MSLQLAGLVSRLFKLGVIGTVGLWVPSAVASTAYRAALNSYGYETNADGTCGWVGVCTLCHRDNEGGEGTVDRVFGQALMAEFGLQGNKRTGETAKLVAVLDEAKAARLDADDDGVSDIDELCGGGDPNDTQVGLGGAVPPEVTEFGCIGTIAGKSRPTNGALLTVILGALLLVVKRRR